MPLTTVPDQGRPRAGEEFDGEEDSWVPLEPPPSLSSGASGVAMAPSSSTTAALQLSRRSNNNHTSSSSSSTAVVTRPDSVQTLQRRVEMRRHLQQRLVHHPIQLLWSHFLWHLAQELWNLDAQVRVSLMFLALGAIFKVILVSTWYLWYPRLIFLSLVMAGSYIYLYPEDIPRRLERFLGTLINLPHKIPETLEHMNPHKARIVCVVLLFVPTILQMRTINFLADLNAQGGGFFWNLMIAFLMAGTSASFLTPPPSRTVRDVFQICLLTLYGSALWIVVRQWKVMTVVSLAAPFFLSTGTLLLAHAEHDNMEWFSQMVRNALRLTLRDILASVGTSVQEDEMLQLAMLRWIVDYWSQTTPTQQAPSQPQQQHQRPTTATPPTDTNTNRIPQQELEWDELLPMLSVTTDQMTAEVHTLQQQQQQQNQVSIPTMPAASNPESTRNSSRPADDPLRNLQTMLTSMNIDDRAKPAVAAYKRNVEEFPPSRDLALAVSIARRCPAFLSFLWQLAVASMFQSYSTTLSIFLLLVPLMILEVLRIQAWSKNCATVSRVLDLSDETTAESEAAETAAYDANPVVIWSKILPRVDPMTILLSGDDEIILATTALGTDDQVGTPQWTIPTLLLVWKNIQSSVGALEVSLTAARCIQTGAVALEFGKNVSSLLEFGNEVSRHGWMHGCVVIAKELIFDHQGDINSTPRGSARTFTNAAVNAVHNSQRVAHNLRVLAEEDDKIAQFIGPIVGFFGFLGNAFHQTNNSDSDTPTQQETAEATMGEAGPNQNDDANNSTEHNTGQATDEEPIVEPVADYHYQPVEEEDTNSKEQAEEDTHAAGVAHQEQTEEPIDGSATEQGNLVDDTTPESSNDVVAGNTQNSVSSITNEDDAQNTLNDPTQGAESGSTDPPALSEKAAESEPETPEEGPSSTEPAANEDDPSAVDTAAKLVTAPIPEEETPNEKKAPNEDTGFLDINDNQTTAVNDSTITGPENTISEAKEAAAREAAEDVEKLSMVMELIAEAFEKNLIDEVEKNEFCTKLAKNGQDKEFVSGMEATLRGLILESIPDQPGMVASASALGANVEAPAIEPPERCVSPSDHVDGTEVGAQINASMMSDDTWSPIVESVASEEAAIQPLDYSERLADAVRTRDDLATPHFGAREAVATGTSEDDGIPTVVSDAQGENEDNMWVKVGGGIAVLGAVVGGAFLAMHQDNQNNDSNTRRENPNVTIERLDEDESGNEWEATAEDSRRAQ